MNTTFIQPKARLHRASGLSQAKSALPAAVTAFAIFALERGKVRVANTVKILGAWFAHVEVRFLKPRGQGSSGQLKKRFPAMDLAHHM